MRHFDMRDTWGSPIRMDIFKVAFAPSGGSKVRYLIGFKEQSEVDRVPQLRSPTSTGYRNPEDLANELRSLDRRSPSESVGSSDEVESRRSASRTATCRRP